MSKLHSLALGIMLIAIGVTPTARGDPTIAEDFTYGPGCFSNYNADYFIVDNGQLTVGLIGLHDGECGTQYRYALCNTILAGDFLLDAEVSVVSANEFRAGVVYGWQGPQKYYIFHLNDYANGVIQLIAFDISQSPCERMVVSKYFDSQRDHPYHVRIEVSGTRHKVYLDGNLEIDVTDSGYAGGQIGLAASFNGVGRFDNVRVEGTATQSPPTQSVVLDFETAAPFRVVVPVVNLPLPNWVPFVGNTPAIDQADIRLVNLLQEPVPDKSFSDFQQDILRRVREEFSGFRVEFVLSRGDASLPPPQQSTVYFSGHGPEGFGGAGMAVWWNVNVIDICNVNKTDSAIVFLPLDNGYEYYQSLVRLTSNAVVHEVGHLFGLWHTYPLQPETQHMWHQNTEYDRNFVGRSLCVLPVPDPFCRPADTQNDRATLALSVGSYPWMETQLGSHGYLDGVCFLAKAIVDVQSTSSLYGLKALACSPPDACRLIDIGDVPAGENRVVEIGVGPGEFLTITGSSLPVGPAANAANPPVHDVFAYFGSPTGSDLSDLDPSLFALLLDATELSVQTHTAVLLQTDGTLVTPVGDATGTASQTGDVNVDGSVGADDYRVLSNCLMGPDAKVAEKCRRADLDGDQDVDLRDLSYFLDIMSFHNLD